MLILSKPSLLCNPASLKIKTQRMLLERESVIDRERKSNEHVYETVDA